ncbi:MAG: ABC transporter ATP-binding protein [Firmicutes bacterium]|nr:ABC transporter ATP-binding protein [Bacillota bacterium]
MTYLIRLLFYARSQWWRLFVGFVGAIVEMILALMVPMYTRQVVDRLAAPGLNAETAYGFLNIVAFALLVFGLIRAISIFIQVFVTEKASQEVAYALRNDLYDKLQRQSFSFYDKAATGELMSRLTSDVEMCREAVGFGMSSLLGNGAWLIGVAGYLFYLDWRYTLICLSTLPLLYILAVRYTLKVEPMYTDVQEQRAKLTAVAQENFSGVRVVRAFSREEEEIQRFHVENENLCARVLKAARTSSFYHPAMDFLANLGTVLVLWYGGREVIQGTMTLGSVVAFHGSLWMLFWPVRALGYVLGVMQRAAASVKRVFELLDAESVIKEKPGAVELTRAAGEVRFENVSFAYADGVPVLKNITFEAKPGEIVAIVGSTGSGKSTLVNLIPRFYDVTGGRVTIDGYDVRDLTLASLRRQIGIVMQETFLFSTTIRENIAYGRPGASMEEVEAAARAAAAHKFITELPQGYDTVVGERGVGLSGGQRQRVAIARALLADPRILILDDSTSSVDLKTEREIQEALRRLMQGRTTFVIAQRLSTVQQADKILVLDNGRIVQEGTHAQLVQQGGVYQQILESQILPASFAAS